MSFGIEVQLVHCHRGHSLLVVVPASCSRASQQADPHGPVEDLVADPGDARRRPRSGSTTTLTSIGAARRLGERLGQLRRAAPRRAGPPSAPRRPRARACSAATSASASTIRPTSRAAPQLDERTRAGSTASGLARSPSSVARSALLVLRPAARGRRARPARSPRAREAWRTRRAVARPRRARPRPRRRGTAPRRSCEPARPCRPRQCFPFPLPTTRRPGRCTRRSAADAPWRRATRPTTRPASSTAISPICAPELLEDPVALGPDLVLGPRDGGLRLLLGLAPGGRRAAARRSCRASSMMRLASSRAFASCCR